MSRFIFFITLMISSLAFAHPTSFKGSWIFESKFSAPMTEMGLGHTFANSTALWVKAMGFPMQSQETLGIVQVNHLLKRWNATESQGNLYIGAGGGSSLNSRGPSLIDGNVALGFLQADWETREVYFMLEHQSFSCNAPHTSVTRARAGVAPYLADFDQQSAWMILETAQFDHQPLDVRGILRLYYRNILYEVGGSMNGQFIVNLMSHF